MVNSYRDLEVWQKAMVLVKNIYTITKAYPKEELYGLTNQMRRAAVSIPSNIAEGKARQTRNEYAQFLYIALGSLAELQTQITISKDLTYIDERTESELLESTDHIARMTRNLIKGIRTGHHNTLRTALTENR